MLLSALLFASLLFTADAVLPRKPSFLNLTNALVSKFDEFNKAPDVIASFDRLGENSQELFRLASPVGKRLISVVNNTAKTNPEEIWALAMLRNLFKAGNSKETAPNQRYRGEISVFKDMASLLTVTMADNSDVANLISRIGSQLYDVTAPPKFMLDPYFNIDFYNIHDAGTITKRVDFASVVHCRAPNGLEFTKHLKVQDAVNRLASRLSRTHQEELAKGLNEGWDFDIGYILRSSLRAPVDYVNKFVNHIDAVSESSFSSGKSRSLYGAIYDALTETFYKLSGPAGSLPHYCKNLPETFAINRVVLRKELTKIRGDLLRIVLISSMIEAKSSRNDGGRFSPPANYDITGNALKAMEKTGKEIAKWAREIQEFDN